jgi:hypothetical protein
MTGGPVAAELEHALTEAEDVATLHELNAQRVRALAESGAGWFAKNLSGDFVGTCADGSRVRKAKFLELLADRLAVDAACDDIDVRPLGDVALVQGVIHCTREGVRRSSRYTDVWRRHEGRWWIVATQLTAVMEP